MNDRTATPLLQLEPLYLEKPQAAAYLSLSISTFEALSRTDADFPKGRKLSPGRVGYLVAELRAWGQTRPVSDMLPPPNTSAPKPRRTREEAA